VEASQELEQLRARVAHLESLVEQLTRSRTVVRPEASPPPTSGVDRRRMLRHGLGLSAAAVAGVGMLDAVGSSAAAADGDAVMVGQTVSPTSVASAPTRIVATGSDVHAGAVLRVDNSAGGAPDRDPDMSAAIVASYLGKETPDNDIAGAAIIAMTDTHIAIQADSTNGWALQATTQTGTAAIFSSDSGSALAAYGETAAIDAHSTGPAVTATSKDDFGVNASGVAGVVGTGHKDKDGDGGWGVAGSGPTGVYADGTEIGVDATSDTGIGVKSTSKTGVAVDGYSHDGAGVQGASKSGPGVSALSDVVGVESYSSEGVAVVASSDTGTAVQATCGAGTAVSGESEWDVGVKGTSTTSTGVIGDSRSGVGVHATSTSGTGLMAVSSQAIGATFQGAGAAIRLVPRSSAGHPTTGPHQRGELVVDHGGKLWLCTKPGTPGTWKQVAFV
jgi:hypothetical protein